MYWPTTTARRLHLSPSGLHSGVASPNANGKGDATSSQVVHIARSHDGEMWASLTEDALSIWSVRPAHVVASLVRTPKSLQDYGANTRIQWNTDGLGVVVETDASYLLLYSLHHLPPRQAHVYSYVPSTGSGARSRTTKELLAPSLSTLRTTFAPGPGEGHDIGEGRRMAIDIRFKLVLRIDAGLSSSVCTDDYLVVATCSPPAVQCIPWPDDPTIAPSGADKKHPRQTRTTVLSRLDWIVHESDTAVHIISLNYSHEMDLFVWITSDGRAYCAQVEMDSRTSIWRGRCFHGNPSRLRSASVPRIVGDATNGKQVEDTPSAAATLAPPPLLTEQKACFAAINARFSLLAVGQHDGTVSVYTFRAPDKAALFSHTFSVRSAMRSTASYLSTGQCTSLEWSSDGHALAVGWQSGWSVWSTFGKLMGCSLTENWQDASKKFSDTFMRSVKELFWSAGNTDLFVLCGGSEGTREEISSNAESRIDDKSDMDRQIFVLPFAKSAVANQHSPDNTRYAFVQLDDSVLVYRGSDQPDMSIINPESDVWHHIKIPQSYLAVNWPVRFACISNDGRLIAVAGRRGLTHFSTLSGRWKQFQQPAHEQHFVVEGGLQWYQHVLVAACHFPETNEHQIRLYSRDLNLDEMSVLYTEHLASPVVLTSLFDNSLLVYTADNTLHHFLIAISDMEIGLTLCGSITFEGVVGEPSRVRGMSWLVPPNQQRYGDPMDDLMMATIIFLIDGKLVLLRPRRSSTNDDEEEVSYDMQILADQIEYYWTHLQGVGTLENSLWGYDGRGIKLWLDALTIEQADVNDKHGGEDDEEEKPEYRTIEESLSIPLDFYPLCVLIEKGIIIGVDPEVSLRRSLEFAIFRSTTNTQLFVQHVLRNYLEHKQMREAVLFASFYRPLVYFAHALEILLHDVLEEEADNMSPAMAALTSSESDDSVIEHAAPSELHLDESSQTAETIAAFTKTSSPSASDSKAALLPLVVAFLDHFDECLDVVVNCARKTEVARWNYLFSVVGDPRELFEVCLERGNYKAAGSYLLVLHNLDNLEESQTHTVRLLSLARQHGWHNLCKDLLRFTRSLDDDGRALRAVVAKAGLTNSEQGNTTDGQTEEWQRNTTVDVSSDSNLHPTMLLPTLQRTTSAPNVLDSAIIEEDEEDDAQATSSTAHLKPPLPHRSTSLFTPSTHDKLSPPRPHLGLNGRILPATTPPLSSSSIELRRSSSSNGSSSGGGGGQRSPSVRRSPSISSGLGMSLSKVGLRSSEQIWDGASSPGATPRSPSLSVPLPTAD